MADELQYSSKRKYEDQKPPQPSSTGPRRPTGFSAPISSIAPDASSAPASYNNVPPPLDEIQQAKQRAQEIAARLYSSAATAEAKRPRVENGGSNDDFSSPGQKPSGFQGSANPSLPAPYGYQGSSGYQSSSGYQGSSGFQGSNKKIEIPNGRVGVIIGKGGETIKYLQLQSGAKIQVTRDMDADPNSPNRLVELMGTPEQISKAEQLIKDVLTEAETGGSGLVSKRFTGQPLAEQFSMKVPSNKVGLIIGKGGETIKNMQARSGARIQLIPLHLPPGDPSTERTVYIDGNQEQIEAAKELVNEVISENRVRNQGMGGGYSQQGFHSQAPSWTPPGPATQQPGYGYAQPGAYAGAPPQYNTSQPPYTGYPQSNSTGWDQATVTPSQQTTQGSGYDYYNQQPPQQPTVGGSSAPSDNTGFNYNQSQGSYAAGQQGFTQDGYGGAYPSAPQAGYGQAPANPQTGYNQAYNSNPSYGSGVNPGQDGANPTYGTQGASTQVPTPIQPGITTTPSYVNQQPSTTPTYPTQGPQSSYPPSSESGYGTPLAPQTAYAPSTQGTYGPPQGQKPPSNQAVYGTTQQPSSQAGYIQPVPVQSGYSHSQSTPTHSGSSQADSGNHLPPASGLASGQAGYGQAPYSAPATAQPGYHAQLQRPYVDSYAGAYSQPPVYSGDGAVGGNAHSSYETAPGAQSNQHSGVVKTSPQS